jgi:hypothetical protein
MARAKTVMGLEWPIRVIDFEASSLELEGYPIEVGLAVWTALDGPVLGWSTLIRPEEDWLRFGDWSKASRDVHGIAQSDLRSGRPATEVAALLNALLPDGAVVWCDGGPYDAHWARKLFLANRVDQGFALHNWSGLLSRLDGVAQERAWQFVERNPSPHRARADAENLLNALMWALGRDPTRATHGELCNSGEST